MSKRRCDAGVAVLFELLYAVGEHDGQSYLNSIERYDPQTNQWSCDVAPTTTCRTSVGVAVLENFLYSVGGQDGVQCLNHVERYDPKENKPAKVAAKDTSPRQAAIYGCGVIVRFAGDQFALTCAQTIPRLIEVVEAPNCPSEYR